MCPHCQARERAAWVDARIQELLPCGYFHIVFTVAPELRTFAFAFAFAFPDVLLGALMRAASDAIDLAFSSVYELLGSRSKHRRAMRTK